MAQGVDQVRASHALLNQYGETITGVFIRNYATSPPVLPSCVEAEGAAGNCFSDCFSQNLIGEGNNGDKGRSHI
jgi:hypothetical protein